MISISDYVKLGETQKEQTLRRSGIFIEQYPCEQGSMVSVYFLNGFYVEVTSRGGKVVDNIPFKRRFSFGTPSPEKNRKLELKVSGY